MFEKTQCIIELNPVKNNDYGFSSCCSRCKTDLSLESFFSALDGCKRLRNNFQYCSVRQLLGRSLVWVNIAYLVTLEWECTVKQSTTHSKLCLIYQRVYLLGGYDVWSNLVSI